MFDFLTVSTVSVSGDLSQEFSLWNKWRAVHLFFCLTFPHACLPLLRFSIFGVQLPSSCIRRKIHHYSFSWHLISFGMFTIRGHRGCQRKRKAPESELVYLLPVSITHLRAAPVQNIISWLNIDSVSVPEFQNQYYVGDEQYTILGRCRRKCVD